MHHAVIGGDTNEVRRRLKHGEDANETFDNDWAPLHWACIMSHYKITRLLLIHGARVDARDYKGNTPLHLVADEGNEHIVDLLVAHGADVNATNNRGETPLHYSLVYYHPRFTLHALLRHGANPMLLNNPLYLEHNRYNRSGYRVENEVIEEMVAYQKKYEERRERKRRARMTAFLLAALR